MSMGIFATCRNCGKEFTCNPNQFYDSSIDNNVDLPEAICPYCSTSALLSIPFFYWNKNLNVLFIVIPSEHMNQFEWDLNVSNMILEEQTTNLSPADQLLLKNSERRFIESKIFISAIKNEKNADSLAIGMRYIRFTPALRIKIDPEYQFAGKGVKYGLSKNDVRYIDNGLSPLQLEIIDEVKNKFRSDGFALNVKSIDEDQHPVASYGLTDILLVIGSAVVLPVLVKVLSDIITDFRHNRQSRKINKHDIIEIKIIEDGTKKEYFFKGPADLITEQLKECASNSVKSLTIPNVCHVAVALDNNIADGSLPPFIGFNTFNEMAKEYIKHFDPKSAVEFIKTDTKMDEGVISHKAKILMEAGDFENAYWIMRPYLDKAQTIEFIFNFAYCISKLGDNDATEKAFYDVLRKYLLRLDLNDLSLFEGNLSCKNDTSAFDNVTNLMLDRGEIVKDEDGDFAFPMPTFEEAKKNHEGMEALMKFMGFNIDFSLDELREEADFNSCLLQVKENIEELDREIQKVFSIALEPILKWRAKKENGEITENEWEEGLLDENFLDSQYKPSDSDANKKLNELFSEKERMEAIEKMLLDSRKMNFDTNSN